MDGDAAHVPLKWVTAVLTEAVDMLKDPKVYVLPVLGLQSSGISTMLNTTFGLQFNVGSGRCTHGAFMQLLSLDKKLKKESNFRYILVIDTEGLRAPELESISTQKHDNELATFVIGLASTTLINIYGEVPGDIDDILQTSVHARMNKVNYRKSCQFVHQNAGSSINTALGSEKFTQKLNKFTVDAAREEGCEGEYETFNDVIKFDNLRDVHHFPGLWKGGPPMGGPPMAPVSLDYSSSAQNLKYHLITVLKNDKRLRSETLTLSSFRTKLSDLWDAVLKEKFVFSFKNTLEITAYNSLETMYTRWDWNFHEEMLKWEQQAENLITTADPNTISELVKQSTFVQVYNFFNGIITDSHKILVQKMTDEILDQARLNLQAFKGEKTNYNPAFTQFILRTMDCSISSSAQNNKKTFSLTQKYRFDMYLTACACAIPVFEEIARLFQKRNDPLEYLELVEKKPLYAMFKDQYYQTRDEEAIANNICAHLERPIKSQIEKSLGSKIGNILSNILPPRWL